VHHALCTTLIGGPITENIKEKIINLPWRDGLYSGEVLDGVPHGQGVWHDDKGSFEGEFKNGRADGQGKYTYENGSMYVGVIRHGLYQGYGVFTHPDEFRAEGQFKDQELHGQGKIIWRGLVKEGEFVADELHAGTVTHPDGRRWEGEFKDDDLHGTGKMTAVNGVISEGQFRDGRLQGHGTRSWPDGARYVGEFCNDERHGQGTVTHPSGTVEEGEWRNGLLNGNGSSRFAEGGGFEGTYRDNLWEYGTLTHPDGARFVGHFVEGKTTRGSWYDNEGNEIEKIERENMH
jgi:hypothetical protein